MKFLSELFEGGTNATQKIDICPKECYNIIIDTTTRKGKSWIKLRY